MLNPTNPGASHLNHIGQIYAGALAELGQGRRLPMIPQDHPGLPIVRDLLQLVLFQRAEINGLTKLLLEKGVATSDEVNQVFQDEYEWLAGAKADQLGKQLGLHIAVTDYGLSIRARGPGE